MLKRTQSPPVAAEFAEAGTQGKPVPLNPPRISGLPARGKDQAHRSGAGGVCMSENNTLVVEGTAVVTTLERQAAVTDWLLTAADDREAAPRQWQTQDVALLACGALVLLPPPGVQAHELVRPRLARPALPSGDRRAALRRGDTGRRALRALPRFGRGGPGGAAAMRMRPDSPTGQLLYALILAALVAGIGR